MKLKTIIMTITLAIALSACTSITEPVIEAHGYSPHKDDINNIKVNLTTKQNIVEEYGEPLIKGVYDDSYWYYISYQTKQYGFGKRKYIKINIAEIKFNQNTVSFVKLYDKSNLNEIKFSKDITNTSGKKLSAIEQIIGNIGRFRITPREIEP